MTPEKRVNELRKRQVWYGSSLVVKLHSENGYFFYTVYRWIDQGKIDSKSSIESGKYNGEDPEDIFERIEAYHGKYKLGKRVSRCVSS